jgi:hypothetical protein
VKRKQAQTKTAQSALTLHETETDNSTQQNKNRSRKNCKDRPEAKPHTSRNGGGRVSRQFVPWCGD